MLRLYTKNTGPAIRGGERLLGNGLDNTAGTVHRHQGAVLQAAGSVGGGHDNGLFSSRPTVAVWPSGLISSLITAAASFI